VIIAAAALPTAAAAQTINPYLPRNAMLAGPPSPYNLNFLPRNSNRSVVICPTCVPAGAVLPDLPPIREPFPSPFGKPVSVP
jgi:hypothetical protein